MQSDLGKLFIGGISWDTNEESLKKYFSSYGEVLEAVIMKDRNTGRARGFGFVVFADPAAAERVVKGKHNIDGRMVEAKKAVPRDDQSTPSRANSSVHGSPSQARTRKIFVGGLASLVTENDFKEYFEQFGTITDVVVMYDHNTQRPRGFGFITYDSEEAVDKVLLKTFHELNGKMVEVKRAVPKELSPSPVRSPLVGFDNYGLNRVNNSFLDGFTSTTIGNYGFGMNGPRFNLNSGNGRNSLLPFGPGYEIGGMNTSFGNNLIDFGRGVNPNYIGNSSNRFGSRPFGYDGGNSGTSSFFSMNHDLWPNRGNSGTNPINSRAFAGPENENIGGGVFGNNGVNWSPSPIMSTQSGGMGNTISTPGLNLGYGRVDNNIGMGIGGGYGRNIGASVGQTSSYAPLNGGYEEAFSEFNDRGTIYGDPTWLSENSERERAAPFDYGLGRTGSDASRNFSGYVEGYNTSKKHDNRGVFYPD